MTEYDSARIGYPSRRKWQAFLDRAMELEYLTPEEHLERSAFLAECKSMQEVYQKCLHDISDYDMNNWSRRWGRLRMAGLQPSNDITPRREAPRMIRMALWLAVLPWIACSVLLAILMAVTLT